jgi:hypothetical protein
MALDLEYFRWFGFQHVFWEWEMSNVARGGFGLGRSTDRWLQDACHSARGDTQLIDTT